MVAVRATVGIDRHRGRCSTTTTATTATTTTTTAPTATTGAAVDRSVLVVKPRAEGRAKGFVGCARRHGPDAWKQRRSRTRDLAC